MLVTRAKSMKILLSDRVVRLSAKGNTGSRLFTKVEPYWTGLISGWVTTWIISLCCTPWEVKLAVWTSITPSTSATNVVCGLIFSRSQPDFEGFFRALRFPPSLKSTPIWRVRLSMGIWFPPTTIQFTKFKEINHSWQVYTSYLCNTTFTCQPFP